MGRAVNHKILECPKELYVGIQESEWEDNPLAYVTYKKDDTIAKEKSFEDWCRNKTDRRTFPNIPQRGFKVLFNVGGCQSGWNTRQSYFRVVDPRGFEFEIVADNFTHILQNSIIDKGVIDGEFAYAWQNAQLLLISSDDPRYIEGVKSKNAELSEDKITKDNIHIGQAYRLRDHQEGYYIGCLKWHGYNKSSNSNEHYSSFDHFAVSMFTFICKNDNYDSDAYPWIFVGYRECKNIKFALNESISMEKVNDAVNLFLGSHRGSEIDNIEFSYSEYCEDKNKKNFPECFEEYSSWVTSPFNNQNVYYSREAFKYEHRHFYIYGHNRLDTIISFKFPDGTIKNFLYEVDMLTDDNKHIIEDHQNQIDLYDCRTSHNDYELYRDRHNEEWKGDVSQLIPTKRHSHYSYYWSTNMSLGKVHVPMNVGKTYEKSKIPKDIFSL